jgi:hypothetical protein
MANKKWESSGLYSHKAAAENGANWWRNQGYNVRVSKVAGGYKHYRRKK